MRPVTPFMMMPMDLRAMVSAPFCGGGSGGGGVGRAPVLESAFQWVGYEHGERRVKESG